MRLLHTVTVAKALREPRNNFTLLRLALAMAVVLSHGVSVVTGEVAGEPLVRETGFTLGEHAVNGFFAISGFLVTMSFERRGWRDYAVARTLRIAPGLVVAVLAVALLLGGAMTRLPLAEYLASPDLRRFVAATLTTFKSNLPLPGVFEQNPLRFPMGTVWTLKYEVLCYLGVFGLGVAGLLRVPWAALLLVLALAGALAVLETGAPGPSKGLETALRLPLIFACGGAAYLWREHVPLSGALAAALVAVLAALAWTPLYKPALFVGTAYLVLWLALSPALSRRTVEPEADLSYGTYLYGWPVQQTLHALWPALPPLALIGPSVAVTLLVAALSWFLVEKPALALKARALRRRTVKAIEPAAP
jgi:peptidoglycan/LPS O-acetylase OafA/YrhL